MAAADKLYYMGCYKNVLSPWYHFQTLLVFSYKNYYSGGEYITVVYSIVIEGFGAITIDKCIFWKLTFMY